MKLNEKHCVVLSRCLLVPYCRKHVLKYHNWMKSEELQELTASEPLNLEEEYEMQISWHEDEKKCTFIILDKVIYAKNPDNEISAMIGDVNLFFNDFDDDSSAELEIMIAESDARGKGIGKQAALAMIYYGITSLKVKTFTAKIGYANTPSLALFDRLGFVEVSRSEAFREVTLQLAVTEDVLSSTKSILGDYRISDYDAAPA